MRLHCDLPAQWRNAHHEGGTRVLNMSRGGLLLAAVEHLAPGERLTIDLQLDEERISLAVEVRFVGATRYGPGCGAAIVDMPPEARVRWAAHYRKLAGHAIESAPPSVGRYLRKRTEGDH